MQYQNNKIRVRVSRGSILRSFCKMGARKGLTLLEMILAMAIMAIVFAVIVPLLRPMLSSWDSRAGAAEALQNGRVLIDHLNHNLSKAVKITDVSGSAVTEGYIEYEDNDGNTCRYAVASSYARFGVVGDLSDLAGPVSQLQFTCYDACDFNTPIIDVNSIRFVKAETTLTNAEALGQDKSFIAQVYLRANASSGGGGAASLGKYTAHEHDIVKALESDLVQVDANHYLCAYSGNLSDGYAVVLAVDVNGTWDINTAATALEYDTDTGLTPALAQIDSTHYLCAYAGKLNDGFAVVLTVDTGTWDITAGTAKEYDGGNGVSPALAQIDSTHYLCAYEGGQDDGWAVVLTVNTSTWEVTAGTLVEYEAGIGQTPALVQIDSDHYLCAYDGVQDDGWAQVLTVDVNGTWDITPGTAFEYDILSGIRPALAQIDSTHYLCAHTGSGNVGHAVVLTVDVNGTWDVNTAGTPLNFDSTGLTPSLAQIDSTNYLCAYTGSNNVGYAVVLTVDTDTWDITEGTTTIEYDATAGIAPALAEIIDGTHYLCAYEGPLNDGFAVVLNYTAGGGGTLMP